MAKKLLIVESPTKTKTLKRYLGPEFEVMATVGHIKDLPKDRLGVDINNEFKPEYVIIEGKEKIIKELKKAAKKAEEIYLGPDPDREGEAIAWHVAEELKNGKKIYRVLFNEITKKAVKDALSFPQQLDRSKFESQMARRILDRLVGYQISPLLWKKVKQGLSAGRVQSVALRMICEREKEIFSFEPEEYWTLDVILKDQKENTFKARLIKYKDEKIELKNEKQVKELISLIEKEKFEVISVSRKKKKKNPPPPFTTSLMQQEAYKKLGFPAKKTMFIAQNLYEGVELGEMGQTGLITYMRTDSFRISDEAISTARDFISKKFGKEYIPSVPNRFKSKKGAQEAHEAIRPTMIELEPDRIAKYLSKEQLSLYRLIWNRFLASQMSPAIIEQTQIDIKAGDAIFRVTGSVLVFDGFTVLYEEEKEKENNIPSLRKSQVLKVEKFEPAQHFTQPPPRYTDASLIKDLEKHGIGRPSTYATILEIINNREYVVRDEKKRFKPTELGFLVSEILKKNFPDIMDIDFTAKMESYLDKIEQKKSKWVDVIKKFYKRFSEELKKAEENMKGELSTELFCPECGAKLIIKSGKNGLFLSCSKFPECKFTSNFSRDESGNIIIQEQKDEETEQICEYCGRAMVIKRGRFGPFLACSGYPECKNTKKIEEQKKLIDTGIPCPEAGCDGRLIERVTKKGKRFFGCSNYPKCKFAMWDEPFDGICPVCGTKLLRIKRYKDGKSMILCRNKECEYKEEI